MKDLDFCRIGKKIRDIRIEKRLTQEYIADMADVNTSHISNIENDRAKISLPTLVHVCNALDTTVDHILAEEYKDPLSAIDQAILHELRKCDAATKERILKIVQILQ
ncbi:MAG: helix-turn-helix transcriptional regulator [Oscillospiraceae bacterium]|nr:helix-turn-helix transcriptional regulator [Oscillospiraceae bacterium]